MTANTTTRPPQICPQCGFNLEADGYPLEHRNDQGEQCPFQWAPRDPRAWQDHDEINTAPRIRTGECARCGFYSRPCACPE